MSELLVASGEDIAKRMYEALQAESNYSARSLQAKDFQVGVSDLGFCPERTRRMLDQQVPEDTDMLTAWIGTELGRGIERVAQRVWPDAILQSEVSVTLCGPDSGRFYNLTGHPDIVLPADGIVLDGKTDYGLSTVERSGPTMQQQFQRHLYGLGAWEAGMFGDLPIEEVRVGNVWLDRAGIDKRMHCNLETLSTDVIEHAAAWLDNVVYAYLQGEEAEKAPPRDMCAVVCGFYPVCRAYDTDVQGLLDQPEVLDAVTLYREGADLERRGKRLKDEAKQHLVGVQGSTGEFTVRWTHVNETVVPESTRRAYDKLDLRPIPKRKR